MDSLKTFDSLYVYTFRRFDIN